MILYCYNESGAFTGPVSPALSPARPFVNGQPNYLRPVRSTNQAPPAAKPGFIPMFDGAGWSLAEDHRGTVVYDTVTLTPSTIRTLGPIPAGSVATPPPSPNHTWNGSAWVLDLATAKSLGQGQVNQKAEALRMSLIPGGGGQLATYQRKEDQARACLADAAPEEGKYPALSGEVGVTGSTLAAVAQAVVAKADAWWAFGDALEAVRMMANAAIDSAASPEQIDQIVAQAQWPATPGA